MKPKNLNHTCPLKPLLFTAALLSLTLPALGIIKNVESATTSDIPLAPYAIKQEKAMGKDKENLVQIELGMLNTAIDPALTALKEGRLECFDALCGDTSCQLRVPLVIELYLKYKDLEKKKIPMEDQLAVTRLYLLTLAKRLACKSPKANEVVLSETMDECAAGLLLNKTQELTKIIETSKVLVAKNALRFLQKTLVNRLSSSEVALPTIEIALRSVVETTPCVLGIHALLTYLHDQKIPLIIRGCGEKEEAPFVTTKDNTTIDTSLDDQPLLLYPKDVVCKETDPICIIDGIIGNKKALEQSNFQELCTNILIPNAAQHYQVGGCISCKPLCKQKNQKPTKKDLKTMGSDLQKLVDEKICTIPEKLLSMHKKALEKSSEALKTFKILHICASTFGRKNRFLPVPLATTLTNQTTTPKENL